MNIKEKSKNKQFHSEIIKDYQQGTLSISELKKKYNISHGFITNLTKRYKVFTPRRTRPLMKWEDSKLNWLIDNYRKLGRNKCAEILNLSRQRVFQKAKTLGLTRKDKKITEELEKVILINYPLSGWRECKKLTGLSRSQILKFATQNNLKLEKETLKTILSDSAKISGVSKYHFQMEKLYEIKDPHIAYILGIIWADGHCHKKINGVSITLLKSDMEQILPLFYRNGNWGLSERVQKANGKIAIRLQITDLELSRFFKENDYEIKSGASPDKILSIIPENLQHYWWRGYIDGDGCFCCGNEFSITSCFDQDWNFYKNLCEKLQVKYRVERLFKAKGNKCSRVRLSSQEEITKIGNYIYNGYNEDNIGLGRKYLKWKEIAMKERKPLKAFYIGYDKDRNKYTLYVRNAEGKMKFKARRETENEVFEYYKTIL